MPVQEIHAHKFAKSSILSSYQMPKVIPPIEVIRVLNKAKIRFVLVGAYGLVGWRKESRATEDVDVLVGVRHLKKAVEVLLKAFPDLEPVDLPAVVRLRERDTEDVLIDVMKPLQQPYCEALKNTVMVDSEGEKYRIPTLEMAVAMKFSAMISPYRAAEDKHDDARDFIRMVKYNPELDEKKTADLASLIYPDGGKYILNLIRQARAGETLVI